MSGRSDGYLPEAHTILKNPDLTIPDRARLRHTTLARSRGRVLLFQGHRAAEFLVPSKSLKVGGSPSVYLCIFPPPKTRSFLANVDFFYPMGRDIDSDACKG